MKRKRHKEYVVDSTKGTAILNPATYKGDALIQVWIDSRVLASLSNWLDSEGRYTRFMSEVVKDSLQILCDHLVGTMTMNMIESTFEARDLLERKYRVKLNPSGRGEKNALHNIILSSKKDEIRSNISVDVRSDPTVRHHSQYADAELVAIGEEQLRKVRAKLGKTNYSYESVTKEGMTDEEADDYAKRDAEKLAAEKAAMDEYLDKLKSSES